MSLKTKLEAGQAVVGAFLGQFFVVGTDALFLTKSCRRSLDLWDKYSD